VNDKKIIQKYVLDTFFSCDSTCKLADEIEDIVIVTELTQYMRQQIEKLLCLLTDDNKVTLIDSVSTIKIHLLNYWVDWPATS
jgi:hypothetical protein